MRIASSLSMENPALTRLKDRQQEHVHEKQLDKQFEAKLQQDDVNQAARETFDQRQEHIQAQVIEGSFESLRANHLQRVDSQQNLADLPHRNQQAIQTFVDNRPSVEEQLGVELAGIDTFA